jgi:DNA-binding NtrC family response regulator
MPDTSERLRVLVVDDEFLIRWSLVETLVADGHSVVEAQNAAAARLAIAAAARNPFDVILLDYRLPDSQDLGLLADLRRSTPTSAIVFVTAGGYATADVVDTALALGACRALTKPIDMETIGRTALNAVREMRERLWAVPAEFAVDRLALAGAAL